MFKNTFNLVAFMMTLAFLKLSSFFREQRGVTAIEYALIAVAISSMLFLVLGSGGEDGLISRIKDSFRSIQDGLTVSKGQGK